MIDVKHYPNDRGGRDLAEDILYRLGCFDSTVFCAVYEGITIPYGIYATNTKRPVIGDYLDRARLPKIYADFVITSAWETTAPLTLTLSRFRETENGETQTIGRPISGIKDFGLKINHDEALDALQVRSDNDGHCNLFGGVLVRGGVRYKPLKNATHMHSLVLGEACADAVSLTRIAPVLTTPEPFLY